MATLEELEQERERLGELLRGTSKALKRARRRHEVESKAWVLPPPVRRVTIALYHLTDLNAEPVVKYLRARGREQGWPERASGELLTLVEDLYLSAEHSEIAALTDTASPFDVESLALAMKLCTDWQVVNQTRRANDIAGAVPTELMLQQREQLRQAMPEGLRPSPLGVASERRARRWTALMRRRWGGRYSRVPPVERVDATELDAKATHSHTDVLMFCFLDPHEVCMHTCFLSPVVHGAPPLCVLVYVHVYVHVYVYVYVYMCVCVRERRGSMCSAVCAGRQWGRVTWCVSHCGHHQARASWRWYNYVNAQVPSTKVALRLNLDETSVCLYQGNAKGNVFVRCGRRPTQCVPRAKRRCCLTSIAVVCDDTEIQPRLPQVVVGNESTLKAGELATLRASCPPNVTLLRQRSSWSNSVLCAWLVRRIGDALAPYADRYQPVLLLDASKTHITPLVFAACNRAGIWVVLVSARLTWFFQPLDTHGFQRWKARLRHEYQAARIRLGKSDLAIDEFLPCIYTAVRTVLQGTRWSHAFDEDGFGARQALVAARVVRQLGYAPGGQIPATRPTASEVALCFPRRAVVPLGLLWRPFDPAQVAVPPPVTPSVAMAAAAAASGVRGPRTRSEHRAAASAASAVAAAATLHAVPAARPPRLLGRTRSETARLAAAAHPPV